MNTWRLLLLLVLAFGLTIGASAILPDGNDDYGVVWQDTTPFADAPQAFRAGNAAQGFEVYFTDGGLRVLPATDLDPTWEFGLELSGYGRPGHIRPLGEALPVMPADRVEYLRGAVTEAYANGPGGIGITFTVNRAREEIGLGDREILIEAGVSGNLWGEASADGRSVGYFAAGSPFYVLTIGGLEVTDSDGIPLAAEIADFHHLERGRILRLIIRERGAAYPLNVRMNLRNGAAGLPEERAWDRPTAGLPPEWIGATPEAWAAEDINGGGFLDVATGGAGDPLKVYLSVADVATLFPWDEAFLAHPEDWPRMLVPIWASAQAGDAERFGWADADGDGDFDLLAGSESAPDRVYLNRTVQERDRSEALPGTRQVVNGSFETGDFTGWGFTTPGGVWCSSPTVLCGNPVPGVPCAPGLFPAGLAPLDGNCLAFTGWTVNAPGPPGGPPWIIQIYQDVYIPAGSDVLNISVRWGSINGTGIQNGNLHLEPAGGGASLHSPIGLGDNPPGIPDIGWISIALPGFSSWAHTTQRIVLELQITNVSPPDFTEFALDHVYFDWAPFTVSGYKFDDVNGNGVDDGEPTLDGWTIRLQERIGGSWTNVQTVVTGPAGGFAPGRYSITIANPSPNDFRVREAVPGPWDRTTPWPPTFIASSGGAIDETTPGYENLAFGNFLEFSVEGYKFEDVDGDGIWGPGEPALPNWTIWLDNNGNGIRNNNEPTRVTDAMGFFQFTNQDNVPNPLPVYEVVAPGWVNTTPNPVNVPIQSGAVIPLEFGNFAHAEINGMKFEDLNGNAFLDGGEPGLPMWTIELYNDHPPVGNGDTIPDPGELVASTVTSDGVAPNSPIIGYYEFTGLGPGDFLVVETIPMGWTQTVPGTLPDYYQVTPLSGETVANLDFGNLVPGSIHGFKFEDVDGDGVYNDLVDLPLPGVAIDIIGTDGQGVVGIDWMPTDAYGQFEFTGLMPSVLGGGAGTGYTVTETVPVGWVATTPTVFTSDLQSRQELVWTAGAARLNRLYAVPIDGSGDIVELNSVDGTEINRFVAPEAPSEGPDGLAYDGTSLWFINGFGSMQLYELDPDTGAVLDVDPVPGPLFVDGLATVGGMVYLLDFATSDIYEFDPVTDLVTSVLDIDVLNPGVVLLGGLAGITAPDALLATDSNIGQIHEIDPLTGLVSSTFAIPNPAVGVAVIAGEIYLSNFTNIDIEIYDRAGVLQGNVVMPYYLSALGGDDFVPPQVEVVVGDPLMFGNFELFVIDGFKYEDLNGNGTMDPGEPGLDGWTIFLDANGGGILDPGETSAVTVGGGVYQFIGLGPGTFQVREVGQPGWLQISANPPDIIAESGVDYNPSVPGYENLNFGNLTCTPDCSAAADPIFGVYPLDVQFTGTVDLPPGCPAGAVTWSWDFGDGAGTSTDQNPLYTYTTYGLFTWTMTVSVNGLDCTVQGTVDVWPYDLTFMDEYNRSYCCVSSNNGSWSWTYFDPRLGTGNFFGDGQVQTHAGIMTIQSLAGTPWVMNLKYYLTLKRANGFFLYRAVRLSSRLYDLDTTNNQVICASPPAP